MWECALSQNSWTAACYNDMMRNEHRVAVDGIEGYTAWWCRDSLYLVACDLHSPSEFQMQGRVLVLLVYQYQDDFDRVRQLSDVRAIGWS